MINAPAVSIIANDRADLDRKISFEEVYAELWEKKLLWKPGNDRDGIIITIPPSPQLGINKIGFIAVGPSLSRVNQIYTQALHTLRILRKELLFEPNI